MHLHTHTCVADYFSHLLLSRRMPVAYIYTYTYITHTHTHLVAPPSLPPRAGCAARSRPGSRRDRRSPPACMGSPERGETPRGEQILLLTYGR